MWRKIRRVVGRGLVCLVLLCLFVSYVYNGLTRPANLAPEEAGVPGEFVAVAGSLTHYEKAGEGPVPVVLLHGFGSWSFTWRSTLAALGSDKRFTAYAVDMRGFGFTDRVDDALYNAEGYARHVGEFIDALKLENPILVGNSLGGDVAVRVVLDRPGRVRGLVLADAAIYGGPTRWQTALTRILFVPPFNRTVIRLGADWFLDGILDRAYANPAAVNIGEQAANLRLPLEQRGAEDAFIAMARTPTEPLTDDSLARVRALTLVIWGEADEIAPVADGRLLAEQIPNARLIVYPGVGHHPQEEASERFARDLLDFCGSLAPE